MVVSIINKTIHEENASNWLLMLHQIKDATGSSGNRDNGIQVVSTYKLNHLIKLFYYIWIFNTILKKERTNTLKKNGSSSYCNITVR